MPKLNLLWPMRGVVRREPYRLPPQAEGFVAPWAVNVRIYDNIERRLRGGSRPGLTRYVAADLGTTIADIASINTSSTGGAESTLVALVDSVIKTVTAGTLSAPVAYLTDGSGNILTDASGNRLFVSDSTPPSSGFLVVGQQHVFAVTTSGVTKMDPKTGQTDSIVASDGSVPTNCTFGAVYRDRLCLSGEDNAIYMSRQGDYTDWDYGAHVGDQGRPLAFQLALSADVGPLPTAMIAHKDAYLLVASQRSLWVVQGDPAADGSLRRISENVGILSSRAWTRIEDTICFLSEDGIYRVSADGSEMTPLSEVAVPDELRDVDTSTTTVSMGYEHDRMAVHIFLRTSGGSDTHWVYELRTEAWWPVRMQDDHSPLAVAQHDGELLLAGGDGFIRKIGGDDDDGSNIESHAIIGPLRLGVVNSFGHILNLHGMLAVGSGTVTWRVVTGDHAEEAADNAKAAIEAFQAGNDYSSYVLASGNWTAGRANMSYPRTRGVWCCLWIQSTAKWAFEGVAMETVPSGPWRGGQ
jgi:hypothetical protein